MEPMKGRSCLICGAAARNVNLGCLSCESCKVFFRRAAFQNKVYVCKQRGECRINENVRRCIGCRLERCYRMGMRREMIHRHRRTPKMSTTTTTGDDVVGGGQHFLDRLTPFERMCLEHVMRSAKMFPDERDMLAEGVPIVRIEAISPVPDLLAITYVNAISKFTSQFAVFRCIDKINQMQLIKYFFDYFVSLRMCFSFHGDMQNMFLFGDKVLYKVNYHTVLQQLIDDDDLRFRLKSFIWKGAKAIDGDYYVRDIMTVILLFQVNAHVTCGEYVRYHAAFYANLLRRYFAVKFDRRPKLAQLKYDEAMTLVDICIEARSYYEDFFKNLDLKQVGHLVTEIYELTEKQV